MPKEASSKRKRSRGLLEESNSKYDIGPFRVGPFKFIVNYQHPPIDRRTRIITMCIIVGSMLIGLIGWMWAISWIMKSHRVISHFINSFMYLGMAGMAAITLYIWWRFGGRRREERLLTDLTALQSFGPTPYRITVRGRPSELLQFAAIQDGMFEPLVFRTSHRTIGMKLATRTIAVMFLIIFMIAFFVSGAMRAYGPWFFLIAGPALYAVVVGIPDVPTYYRFVPGRMDCLWFSWILPKKPGSMMVNLQNARLSIDLAARRDMIVIGTPVEPVGFSRDHLPDPLNFSLALARAAHSTATPPPLPMDALTG